MDSTAHARAVLARLAARRFGRPVPTSELVDALRREGLSPETSAAAIERLVAQRLIYQSEEGWLPGSLPLASRAPRQIASFSRLHSD